MRAPRWITVAVTSTAIVAAAAACTDGISDEPFTLDRDGSGRIAVVGGHVTARLCDSQLKGQDFVEDETTLGPDDGTAVAATDASVDYATDPPCFTGRFPESALGPRSATGGEQALRLSIGIYPNGELTSRAIFDIPPAGYDSTAGGGSGGGGTHPSGATWYQLSATVPSERHAAAGAGFRAAGPDQGVVFGGIRAMRETCVLEPVGWDACFVDLTGPTARRAAAMAAHAAGDDHLLVLFGGDDGTVLFDDTWLWDGSGHWAADTTVAAPPSARSHHAMATLGDGRVLLFGGLETLPSDPPYDVVADTWVYDAAAGWGEVVPDDLVMPRPRYMHQMASLPDGRVLLSGGIGSDGTYLGDAWIFDPTTERWSEISNAGAGPVAGAVLAPAEEGGQPVLFGGEGPGGPRNSLWVWSGTGFAPLSAAGTTPSHRTAHVGFTFVGAAVTDFLVIGPGFSAPPPSFVPVPNDGSFYLEYDPGAG